MPHESRRLNILVVNWQDLANPNAGGAEIHKPVLEDRPRHRLQRLVYPPVQLDLVVKGAERRGSSPLLVNRGNGYLERCLVSQAQIRSHICSMGEAIKLATEII